MIARVFESGHSAMSHLSILPTVLRDAEGLGRCLEAMGFQPIWGGDLKGFAKDYQPVVLQIDLGGDVRLGWSRQQDGSLALVGDLQRLSRCPSVHDLLGQITHRYATYKILSSIAGQPDDLIGCHVTLGA